MSDNLSGMIQAINLYSGSEGNCTYIKTPDGEFLVDAGKSAKALKKALNDIGTDIKNINAIFITHEHTDHVSALRVLIKSNNIPVYAETGAAECISVCSDHSRLLMRQDLLFSVKFHNTLFTSFVNSHDSASCLGYRIDVVCESGEESLGIATDTGYVTEGMKNCLAGCNSVILECNHDIKMLRNGVYPEMLKSRIMSKFGHLSNDDCANFAAYLEKYGTKRIMLAHLSRDNNTPELARRSVESALNGKDVKILVADQFSATRLV